MGRCSESNEPHRVKWSGGSDSPIVLLDTRERQMPRLALTILTIVLLVAMPSAWAGLCQQETGKQSCARQTLKPGVYLIEINGPIDWALVREVQAVGVESCVGPQDRRHRLWYGRRDARAGSRT